MNGSFHVTKVEFVCGHCDEFIALANLETRGTFEIIDDDNNDLFAR